MVSALLVEYFVIGEGLTLQPTVNLAVFVETHSSSLSETSALDGGEGSASHPVA